MIWIARFIFALGVLTALDLLYGLFGFLLSLFPYRKYPRLHRAGLRLLAMSMLTCKEVLPIRCQLCCGLDVCKNKTCPGQVFYDKNPRE